MVKRANQSFLRLSLTKTIFAWPPYIISTRVLARILARPGRFSLQEKGIDLEEIIKLSDNPDARGTLVEVEEHEKNEKIVIALD